MSYQGKIFILCLFNYSANSQSYTDSISDFNLHDEASYSLSHKIDSNEIPSFLNLVRRNYIEKKHLLLKHSEHTFYNDSLDGFNVDKEIKHILSHGIDSNKIEKYLSLAKKRFINRKYRKGKYFAEVPKNTNISNIETYDCENENWGFEDGTLNGWTQTGAVQVVNDGVDPYGEYEWVYPYGGNFSAKISSDQNGWEDGAIQKTLSVPNNSLTIMSFHFAMSIFNYPHPSGLASRFYVELFDQNGDLLDCPYYECFYSTDSGAVGVNNFQQTNFPASSYNPNANGDRPDLYGVTWADWNTVTLDLTSYQGQNITVAFRVEWCIPGPDWAYVLLDVDCPDFNIENEIICLQNETDNEICGPNGMSSYIWLDSLDNQIGSEQCITINTPGKFYLNTIIDTDCDTSLLTLTRQYDLIPPMQEITYTTSNYNNFNISCNGASDGWILIDTIQNIDYAWPYDQNSFSSNIEGYYIENLNANQYYVTATDSNGCSIGQDIVLNEPEIIVNSLEASDYNSYGVSCPDATDGFILSETQGGVPPYSYDWSNNLLSNPNVYGLGSGYYTISITDLNNCEILNDIFLNCNSSSLKV